MANSRFRRGLRWIKSHRKLSAALALATAILLLNAWAYLHAHAMTHFTASGPRTAAPEQLSMLQKTKVLLTGVRVPKPINHQTPADFGLPYEVHHFHPPNPPLARGGKGGCIELEAWYIPVDRPAALCILFHGYAAAKSSLLPETAALHEMGYATLLVDFRASGGSTGRVTTIGYREADDVRAAVTYARRLLPPLSKGGTGVPLVLYGQSMGAAAVLRAVADHNVRPDALILESPFDRLLSTVENRFSAMNLPSFPAAHLLVFWGGLQHGYSAFRHNPTDYALRVTCPVLLLHGAADPRVTPRQSRAVFDNLDGVKHIVAFENAGHEATLATNPQLWKTAISEFIEETARWDDR